MSMTFQMVIFTKLKGIAVALTTKAQPKLITAVMLAVSSVAIETERQPLNGGKTI